DDGTIVAAARSLVPSVATVGLRGGIVAPSGGGRVGTSETQVRVIGRGLGRFREREVRYRSKLLERVVSDEGLLRGIQRGEIVARFTIGRGVAGIKRGAGWKAE